MAVFLCAIFLCCILSTTRADLIASSQIENCVLDGSTDDAELNCTKKFVVTLSVDNGQNKTEAVQFTISSATEGSQTLQFVNPWTITLSKSPVAIYYPISYLQTVSAAPYEDVIYTTDYIVVSACQSGAYSSNPTCGWYVVDGSDVPNSQISDDETRADMTCTFFSGSSSSAHCLRFSDDGWYDLFQISNAIDMYTISIEVSNGGSSNTTVTLSPSSTLAETPKVIARLLGDFAPFEQLPVYSSKYLAVPSEGNPRQSLGMSRWMLIDTDLCDLSGDSCNKIGVSFDAFNTQGDACKQPVNTCLANQIDDYYNSDLQLLDAGLVGNYFLSFFGNLYFTEADTSSLTNRFLAYDLTDIQASVITLTFSADDIRFVTNESPGQILSAYVATFEALSKDGTMYVVVVNNGTINAEYEVTVTDCSTGIATVLAQEPTLVPNEPTTLTFSIESENGLEEGYQCKVSLLDSQADLLDYRIVFFNTTATDYQTSAQGGTAPSQSGDALKKASGSSCSGDCSFYDIICFISNECWKDVFSWVGTLAGIAAALLILYAIKQHFGWCGLCHKLCCSCSSGSSSKKKKKRKSKSRDEKSVEMKEKEKRRGSSRHSSESSASSGSEGSYSSGSEGSESSYTSSSGYATDSSHSDSASEEHVKLGMSSAEIRAAANHKSPVYLCFLGQVKNLPLYRPGPKFCVVGEIQATHDSYEFSLEAYAFQTKYFKTSTGRYTWLHSQRSLDIELFRMPLNEKEVRKSLTTHPPPAFPCINERQKRSRTIKMV